jgi:hypothetical protein
MLLFFKWCDQSIGDPEFSQHIECPLRDDNPIVLTDAIVWGEEVAKR